MRIVLVLTAFLAAAPAVAADHFDETVKAWSTEDQAIARRAVTRVATVLTNDALCTGTLIAPRLLLTAWHCVDTIRTSHVMFYRSKESYQGRVVAYDDAHDVAVLKLNRAPKLAPLNVSKRIEPLSGSDSVVVIGHPLGKTFSVSAGPVHYPSPDFFSFSARVDSGSSGGPVLDKKGEIVGVTIILNKLIGNRPLGDAAALGPIRQVVTDAKFGEGVSWSDAEGNGFFDLGYGRDRLLDDAIGTGHGSLSYALGFDYYDRWRVGFRHMILRQDRVYGWETGPVFKDFWGDPALLFGRNYYFTRQDDFVANKIGIAFSLLFLDVTIFRVTEGDREGWAYTIGF